MEKISFTRKISKRGSGGKSILYISIPKDFEKFVKYGDEVDVIIRKKGMRSMESTKEKRDVIELLKSLNKEELEQLVDIIISDIEDVLKKMAKDYLKKLINESGILNILEEYKSSVKEEDIVDHIINCESCQEKLEKMGYLIAKVKGGYETIKEFREGKCRLIAK